MRLLPSAAFLMAAAISAWGADAKLLGLLMPDAKLIAGVQLGQAKASPFGQFVLSQSGPMGEFDKLKMATGFDPRTDLTEMVAAAVGNNGGLVAGHGSFQPARLAELATAAGAKSENYRGITLLHTGEQSGPVVAFLDGATVIIGQRDFTTGAVDRWLGGSATLSALAAKASQVSGAAHAWMVASSLAPVLGTSSATSPEAQMMQNVVSRITQVSGALTFADAITMRSELQTTSAQDAQALADVFQFLISMAATKEPLPVTPQVSASGSNVNIQASLTQQQAEQLFPRR